MDRRAALDVRVRLPLGPTWIRDARDRPATLGVPVQVTIRLPLVRRDDLDGAIGGRLAEVVAGWFGCLAYGSIHDELIAHLTLARIRAAAGSCGGAGRSALKPIARCAEVAVLVRRYASQASGSAG